MANRRPRTRETLAANLALLMELSGWSQHELARRSNVSQKQISNILAMRTSCSVETAEALAKPFNLEGWHLILPSLPRDVLTSRSLRDLVGGYLQLGPEARLYVDSILAREKASGSH